MSDWERFYNVARRTYNRQVDREFKDVPIENPQILDERVPRHSLYLACRLTDNDSAPVAACRMMLFYFGLRQAKDMQAPIYGIPTASFQEARKFKPQVQLYFQEDATDVEAGYAPVTGEISFRLMEETSESLRESEINRLAAKVKTQFGGAGRFVWKKGRNQATYTDREHGLALRVLCRSKAEGKRVVEQVLDLQSLSPTWKHLNYSENEDPATSYPPTPPSDLILGRRRRRPRSRPVADVRFQYALLHIHGLPHPIVLCDYSGTFRSPVAA